MVQARRKLPPQQHGQSWATFLANHAAAIWACDFVQTYDLFFRTIFLFFIIEHGSRRVVHCGITRSPSDTWVAQQIREATPFGAGPRFLICDNDDKYGLRFEHAAKGAGIGSVRRECLDFILILSNKHLRRVIKEYITFFNQARLHQGINQQIPEAHDATLPPVHERRNVVALPVLGGLHHDYRWAA
jgi:putative transposase